MKRVVFINPPLQNYYKNTRIKGAITLSPPLNLHLLSASLNSRKHISLVYDYNVYLDENRIIKFLKDFLPDFLCITIKTPSFFWSVETIKKIKKIFPKIKVVAGGPHPSAMPIEVLETGVFDFVISGEGEESLPLLIEGYPYEVIPGLYYLDEGSVRSGRPKRLIENLDNLPFPSWEAADLSVYRRKSLVSLYPPVADLETSRGCPSGCIYCSKSVFGRRFRKKGINRCIEEIKMTLKRGFRSINFVDDNFNYEEERALELCESILKEGLKFKWTLTNGIRVDMVGKDFFKMIKKAGCYLVAFGFETVDRDLLKRCGKDQELDMAEKAVEEARREGITTIGYFMLGLPGENTKSYGETVAFAKRTKLDYAKWSFTAPLPGTPLFKMWRRYIKEGTRYEFNIHLPMKDYYDHPEKDWDELERVMKDSYRKFYFNIDYFLRRIHRGVKSGSLPIDILSFFELKGHF